MAKETKNFDPSGNEGLKRALSHDVDKLHKIPDNWCWTKFESVAQWGSGGTPSRKKPEYYVGNIPWIKTGELNNAYIYETEEHISEAAVANSSAKLFPVNTVVIAMYGATIGKVGIMGIEATTNQACACGVCSSAIDYKYLFYYAISQRDSFISMGKGGAQPNISQEVIKQHNIPLPPLGEQKRIVSCIESYFSKLDEAREKAEEVVDGFEARKAAILQKAFSGELTEKWRRENKEYSYKWKTIRLGDIVSIVKDKYDPLANENNYLPYIGLEHIQKGKGIKNFGSVADVKSLKGVFKKGDILYGKLRPYLDKHGIAEYDGVCSTDILIYRSKSMLVSSFVNFMFSTTSFINYSVSHSKGINLPRTSEKVISDYTLQLPDEDEMEVLVRSLGSLLEKEEKIEQTAEEIIGQIDTMKKAILIRAFRGELGTNDPNEENVKELLKRII